ncbi:MAG: hypothetical protein IJR19_06730, partial [Lachnospiraceae bacterium]|nr:hypothetical protein [Lachnospiraceae bacterium]
SIRDFVKEPYYTVHILAEGSHSDPFMSDFASKFDTAPSGNRTEELDAVSDKYKSREEAVALADLCMGGRCQCR